MFISVKNILCIACVVFVNVCSSLWLQRELLDAHDMPTGARIGFFSDSCNV